MNEDSTIKILDNWLSCTGVKQGKLCATMADILKAPYSEDNFYDDFRRRSRSRQVGVNKLIALIAAFQNVNATCVTIDDAFALFEAYGVKSEEFHHLKVFFPDSEFDMKWNDYLRRRNLRSSGNRAASSATKKVDQQPQDQPFIVGRDDELEAFKNFLRPDKPNEKAWIYNVYGPGGIGKSVVADKFRDYVRQFGFPTTFLNGNLTDLTPTRILAQIAEGFAQDEALTDFFAKFRHEYHLYEDIQTTLGLIGGINEIYDVIGNLRNLEGLHQLLRGSRSQSYSNELEKTLSNRFALERYLRRAESELLYQLSMAVEAAKTVSARSPILIVDTYETIEGLDDWFCRELIPRMNRQVRIAILGRNQLTHINFDWKELDTQLIQKSLPELGEVDAKAYLKHYGLNDIGALDKIYQYVGGYPLLLVLVRDLAREVGWDSLGVLDKGDRDSIAADLLHRILREQGARDVQRFIEQGSVVDWFDANIISVVLEISSDEGRQLFDKIRRYSFVERHQNGLKFHDKIKTIMRERLSKEECDAIRNRVTQYLLKNSGRYVR